MRYQGRLLTGAYSACCMRNSTYSHTHASTQNKAPAYLSTPTGEVLPQAVCSRYGLLIGAYSAWFVTALMWLAMPIAWPISKLLDKLLGTEHSVSGLKHGLAWLHVWACMGSQAHACIGRLARACPWRRAAMWLCMPISPPKLPSKLPGTEHSASGFHAHMPAWRAHATGPCAVPCNSTYHALLVRPYLFSVATCSALFLRGR